MVSSGHFFWGPLSILSVNSHVQADEPRPPHIIQNPDERVAILEPGRHASFRIFLDQLILEDWPLSKHLGLLSLVCHRLCDCQGRLDGVLQRHGVTEMFDPEESAHFSETIDQNTLIQSRWI